MIKFPRKRGRIPADALVKMIWVSTFLAMIFALPGLCIFLGIYYTTGQLLIGAVAGFGVHFVTLAFASKISRVITDLVG